MFKTALFIDIDNQTLNPFACQTIQSLIRGNLIVITPFMLPFLEGVDTFESPVVVIGEIAATLEMGVKNRNNFKYVSSIDECIKYLSKTYSHQTWWVVAENAMLNELIWEGIVMDVHISKNYSRRNSSEWHRWQQFLIPQDSLFDRSLLENLNNTDTGFELISSAKDNLGSQSNKIRHYCRRNNEEMTLLAAMNDLIHNGFRQSNRTGVHTRACFGKQFEYKMNERIDPDTGASMFRLPLLTTKKMFVRGVFAELKWFLSGKTNSKDLESQGVNIWKGNSSREFLDSRGLHDYEEGECGPIYGKQWRDWNGIDQVQAVVDGLQTDPFSRRHIINGWNVSDLNKMCLPPCHVLYQFICHAEGEQKYLSLSVYQRSCDVFHGLPFNISSMGFFLIMMCHQVGMKPYKLIHSIGDAHIYESHIGAAQKQLQRDPCMFPYVRIDCDPKPDVKDYDFKDIVIEDYYSHGPIKADMVV